MKGRILLLLVFWVFCLFPGCGKDEPGKVSKPVLKINVLEKLIANGQGFFEIQVTSNAAWYVESKSTWLKPEKVQGEGNLSIKVNYEANSSGKRSGVIRFTAEGLNPVELIVTQTELTFTNPIAGIPDPWIIKQGGYYYICKAQGNGINVSKSNKLSAITATQSVWKCPYDAGTNKPWNVTNVWAPELHYIDGKWYIYYAAGRPHDETNSYQYQR
ncbi:MAG TPA: family 43 glycosylhydrolase, partial [Bacteroidales bacterium]|nr:family 43 glycosylhydrolase [Bacteroidales bacterium]